VDERAAREAFDAALADYGQEFGRFFVMKLFGIAVSYEGDACIVEMVAKDYMFNPQGSVQGGIVAMVLDIAMGHLIHHVTGRPGLTIEMKTQYLRRVRAGRIRCEGRFLKRGRRVSAMEATMRDETGDLLAAATASWAMPGD
jgi:uncharacterized protein (TIGR00369 family)